ncbi:MAG: U32 family peptidase, partial [archaeon]|nr:U32 family peptidase [archaeon]
MRLSIATTWDDTLLEKLEECNTKYKTIYEIFGALDSSIIGTGRTRTTVPKVTKERVKEHVDFAHSLGIEVDYLLSASCMGGIEYTTKRRRALEQYLDWINSLNIDTVTVSIPYLIELIKNQYPAIKVNVSTIAHVKSVQQAIFFDRLGVDRITVSYMINRYLNLLEAMNKSTKCELEILVNESCMHDCPYRDYHYNLTSHGS